MGTKNIEILKISFWLIISFIILCPALIAYLYYESSVSLCAIYSTSDTAYSEGLNLIFSIIGFLIALIIFLVQYVGSKVDSQELEKTTISNKYFPTLVVTLLLYILFNLIASYLKLGFPFNLISLIFSFTVVLLIGWTILFSLYYLDINNIIKTLTEQTIQFIKRKKQFRKIPGLTEEIGYTKEFISSLNDKTSVFVKICIDAIKRNQDKIVKTSLASLREIAFNYLEQSKQVQTTKDDFLDDLNDQFNYIISESLTSYNQKILENIAQTIGEISENIIIYRRGFAGINNFAFNWMFTLKNFFIKSYPKDRTIVCHVCLEKINSVILLSLEKGYYRSYETYKIPLDDISEILIKVDQQWAALLFQKALLMYQFQFIKFLDLVKRGNWEFGAQFIKSFFQYLAKLINEAKTTHSSGTNNKIIFTALYGLDSFHLRIAQFGLMDIKEERTKKIIALFLKEFIEFNNNILENNPKYNDYRIYDMFPEMLFLITNRTNLNEDDKKMLVENLSNGFLSFMGREYTTPTIGYDRNHFNDCVTDYFALLIFLYDDRPDLIKKVIGTFLEIYKNTTNKKLLYPKLKLISSWINLYENLKEVNSEIIDVLTGDFENPNTFDDRFPVSLFEKYGYPTTSLGGLTGLWYLPPSYMWGPSFQDQIAQRLNSNQGEKYIEFHEMIKKRKNNLEVKKT